MKKSGSNLKRWDMVSEWRKTRLTDICIPGGVQTGPFGSQLHQKDYVEKGTPIITVEHLGDNRISHQNLPRITEQDKERLKKYTLKMGDIVFSRVGSVDRRALVRESEDGWLFSGRCLRVRLDRNKADPAQFGTESFKELMRSIAVGATMPSINTKILSDIEIILPSLPEQKNTAAILIALDDKIELNRRMNDTLEGIAQAVFKSWFVDFDPVKAKAEGRKPEGLVDATAALFPSNFTESNVGLIPEGWFLGKLGDIADNPRTGVQPTEISPDVPYIGLEHMPRRSISLYEWEGAGKVTSTKSAMQTGDFLFGKLRPYFHKVGISPINGITSTDILIVRPKSDCFYSYLLMLISSVPFVEYTDKTSQGTKMPRTSWGDMSRYESIFPNKQVFIAYDVLVRPMFYRIIANIHENKALVDIRDNLLPKLISGKLRAGEISESLEALTS